LTTFVTKNSMQGMHPPKSRRPNRRHLGPHFSEGARLCWLACEKRGWSPENVTALIGSCRGLTTRWMYGDSRPGRRWSGVLFEKLGVPPSAWDKPPRRAFTPPAARAA